MILSARVKCAAGTANPSGAPQITPYYWWGSCWSIFNCRCSVLYVIVCHFFFVSIFAIALSVRLRCMPSDYPFRTFKPSSFVNECFMWNQCIPFIYTIVIHNAIVFLLRMNYKVGRRNLVSSIPSM